MAPYGQSRHQPAGSIRRRNDQSDRFDDRIKSLKIALELILNQAQVGHVADAEQRLRRIEELAESAIEKDRRDHG